MSDEGSSWLTNTPVMLPPRPRHNSVFTALGGNGALAASAFRIVDTSTPTGLDASDRLIFSTWNGFLFYDPDGSGAQGAVAIADLNANTVGSISAADFLIV